MPLAPSLVQFLEHYKKPAKRFRVTAAFSAIRRPTTFDLTDGDAGKGHDVDPSAVTVPRLGPDRYCKKGETLRFYAGDSYVRGGGGAEIEGWTAYYLGTTAPIDSDFGGTEVAAQIVSPAPDGGGNAATAAFTPTAAGHYRIEMHAAGMLLTGDGTTAPYPNACRFVRVFDTDVSGNQTVWDGEGIAQISLNGSIEQGGWTGTVTFRRGRGFPSSFPVENQRVLLGVKTYFRRPGADAWTEYTWNPGHGSTDYIWYSPNQFFEGYVRANGVVEDYLTGDVTIQLVGVRTVLDQLAFPTTIKDIPDEETGEPSGLRESVPTAFIDTASYEAIMSEAEEAEQFLWVHRIADMKYSDVILHLLGRHSDFCTFNDAAIWQNDTDSVPYVELREGNVFNWIKQLETERLGVVFGDAKGVLYAGPDVDLRGDVYWATVTDPDIVIDDDMMRELHVQAQPREVGQVVLRSVDQRDLLPAAFASDIGDDILQVIIRKQYEAVWPEQRGPGTRFELFGVPIFDRSRLATVARKLERKLNKKYPSIQATLQMLTGIDLMQNVQILHTTRSGYALPASFFTHVTGIQMTISPSGSSWSTTLTCSETVDAAAVQVPDVGPTALFSATPFREVLADGTEKRFILLQSQARGGDEPIVAYQWQSDNGGGAKTGARAVYAYDESVAAVTILHTVIDDNGLNSTAQRIITLSDLPANVATFGETLWAASAGGAHVSPDGGATWIESTVPGDATAVWATDDSAYGFFGNAAGQVFLTRDLGRSFLQAAGTPSSPVRCLWGDPSLPSAFVGYANGQVWEVAYSKARGVVQAAELKHYRYAGATGAVTFLYFTEGMIFAAAGDSFYAGTRSDWRRIARFPGTILRGAARSSIAADASAGDNAYTFVISLVFSAGGQNWQEQGRVRVGGRGVEWFTENIVPIPPGSGADTAVGALDQAAPILLSFDAATVPYLLPSTGVEAPGPAIVAATAIPAVTSIKAVEYGYGGRDHAFLGHSAGIYKNFDPNRPGIVTEGGAYVPAPSNIWLPFHATGAQVKDLYVTRPKESTTYRGMVYVLMPAGATRTDVVVWSPKSTPPSFVSVESYHKDETQNNVLPFPNQPSGAAALVRWRSVSNRRLTNKTLATLPPGFRSLSQFLLVNDDAGNWESRGFYYPRIPIGLAGIRLAWPDWVTVSGMGGTNKLVSGERVVGAAAYGNPRGGGAGGVQPVITYAFQPNGASVGLPLLGGGVRYGNHYYARRDHDPQPGIRGAAVHQSLDEIDRATYFYWPIDDEGFILPGFVGGILASGARYSVSTPNFISNEYVQLGAPFAVGLYRLPMGSEPTFFSPTPTLVTGIVAPTSFTPESFDNYWMVDQAGTTSARVRRRSALTTFVEWVFPADLTTYLDTWAQGRPWIIQYPMTVTGLTDEAVILVYNNPITPGDNDRYRMISVRQDGTWSDVSGNLWHTTIGGSNGLYDPRSRPIALRHVLPTEFDPIQFSGSDSSPTVIPPWAMPPEAPILTTPYPVAVLADTPFLYYRLGDHPVYGKAYDATGGGRHYVYGAISGSPGTFDMRHQQPGLVVGDADKAIKTIVTPMYVKDFLLGYTEDWSVEAIVKADAATTADNHYFLSHTGGGSGITSLLLDTVTEPANRRFLFWNGNSGQWLTTALALDTKYHIAATMNVTTGQLTFYVNGVQTYQGLVGAGRHLGDGDTYFWTYYDGYSWPFTGIVDEIAFYKSVLTPARVAAHAALVG